MQSDLLDCHVSTQCADPTHQNKALTSPYVSDVEVYQRGLD